jgi:glycine oxidase
LPAFPSSWSKPLTYDVAIVGGGVIGCAIAAELADAGAKVVLLERDRIGAGASGAAAGMLAPQTEAHAPDPWFDLLLAARAEHEPLSCRLRHETGIDVGYRRDGVLRVAVSEPERRELRARAEWQQAAGLPVEWLEPDDAQRLEPTVSPDIAGALWLPDESQVQSPRLVQALALLAQRRGAHIREGAPVLGVEKDAVRTAAERVSVGAVVLAGGVGSAFVDGARLPVVPVKGQIACGQLTPACAPRHIVWGAGAYLTPKAGGELLVGATEEEGTYDTRPTLGGIAGLIAAGTQLLPTLRDMPLVQAWAGLRPALPDRKPALGRLGDLFVATGHYRNGVLLGPLTGKLIAQLVLGKQPTWDLTAYAPERLAL